MSRVGKMPVTVPQGVDVSIKADQISVKGAGGTLSVAASSLVDDARFWAKLSRSDMTGTPWWTPLLLHYFSIHLRIHPPASVVVDISDVIDTQMAAVAAFTSQLSEGRSKDFPTALDNIRDRARYWGWAIGRGWGEPLLNRESIGISSLLSLLPPKG